MKLIPILLASVSLMTSSNILADHTENSQNTLKTTSSKTVHINTSLHDSSCKHVKNYQHADEKTDPLAKSLEVARTNTRRRFLNAENSNTDNVGINFLNVRIGPVKSTLINKRYTNPNRYQRRVDLPMRRNLQSNPNLNPVFEAVKIKARTQTIPFSFMSKHTSNELNNSFVSLSESEIETLVNTINTKYDLDNKPKLNSLIHMNAENFIDQESACIQKSNFI